jgi:CheY-like chemotaxis protein
MELQDKRIYFVEDDGKNIAVIFNILRQNGATVKFGPWNYAAQGVLEFLPVDIILLDMMLPTGKTGFDVYDEILKVPELQSIPVAAVTARESATAMNQARDLGFKGYIHKPVRVKTFPHYIKTILDGGEVWGNPDI